MTKASPIPNDPGVKQISATENDGLLESTSTTKALAVPSSPAISTTRLHRSVAIVFLVLLYAAFALLAWTITAILTFRPISGQAHYGAWFPGNLDYGTGGGNVHQFYVQSEKWYHAARVIQSMVTLVTIPLTSVVCSNAAIVFITHHQGERLSLRKVITLADKSWTDPLTYPRIVMSWKRYRSRFLLAAFLLTALGAVLSPLQQILLSTKTIKTPVYSQDINSLLDIPNQWDKGYKTSTGRDINLITTITQNALTSASNTEPQSQLWQGAGFSCSPLDLWDCSLNNTCLTEWQNYFSTACGQGNTLGNMSALFDPFLAELPNGFNTGLIRQFAPRINSSATYESVSVSKWPTGCEQLPGAFFVEYSDGYIQPNITGVTWALQACMPANQTQSPWTSTRARQDFSEKLYLNITGNSISTSGSRFYLVTLDTTAGYFELPNYMNNLAPGPLLDQQPDYLCGSDCEQEGSDRLSPAV
ncbi:hypothetical protein OIDMADRAFT_128159 [Oidiodendron maius Zn]|uniref:Uncharacterized protein n=1 Tax=Oidiodendron maius (strain Zn) TaxID=913774 RepID=A0A0C3H600_OIDMZ|nr:hypothetical protein OIDMADRAFT_128159 [Oidiodendron maius Zn]